MKNYSWNGKFQLNLRVKGWRSNSSVDSPASTILGSWDWIPSTSSKLFLHIRSEILYYICHGVQERTKITKRGRSWPMFKSKIERLYFIQKYFAKWNRNNFKFLDRLSAVVKELYFCCFKSGSQHWSLRLQIFDQQQQLQQQQQRHQLQQQQQQ